jgi:hypothetical protein
MSLSFRTSTSSTNISEKLIIAGSGAATFSSSVTANSVGVGNNTSGFGDVMLISNTNTNVYPRVNRSSTSYEAGWKLSTGGTDSWYLGLRSADGVGSYHFYSYTTNSSVVQITSGGDVAIGRTDAGGGRLGVRSGGNTSAANAIYIDNSSSTELFSVRNDGIIRTGTASGSPYNNTSAQVPNLYVSAGGTLERGTSSSMRYKENIIYWEGSGINTILALKPTTFTYKESYYKHPERVMLGLIAEEVAEACPYLADYENEDGSGQIENVRYANIVVPLIKAIQEQQAEIEKLKALIAAK